MATPSVGDAGRVALVTGAAGGLGAAFCRALGARGMHVVAADLREDATAQVVDGLAADGLAASALAVDVTDRRAVDEAVERLVASRGRLDVVVNLAGVLRNSLLAKVDDDDWALVMATHVDGTRNTMRAAIPSMRAVGYGRIVNMSSIAVRGSVAGAAYGAAKGAIEGLSRAAAIELAPSGITVNCVAPGLMSAGMFQSVPEEYQQEAIAKIPMRRTGEPEEAAACVAFLASHEAGYVTGQTLFVCGGASLGF